MKHTRNQTSTRTLADLYRAMDHQHAVTITYINSDNETTIRTIEIHAIRTSKPVRHGHKAEATFTPGDMILTVMCRLRGEQRELHLSGIISYTVHRAAYVLELPAPTTYVRPAPAPDDNADALYFYELARDQDDADYAPRILIQTDTDLAA